MATKVTVRWKAFSNPERAEEGRKVLPVTEATMEAPMFDYVNDLGICNKVYQETNLYFGQFWNELEKVMPKNRSHTALSSGDEVVVSRMNTITTFRCAEVGWEKVEEQIGIFW